MSKSLSIKLFQQNNLILNENNIQYKLVNDILSFNYDKVDFTIDINNKIFKRENDEFKFILDIKNNKCLYLLKEINNELEIKVITSNINIQENIISIDYNIESNENNNELILELEDII